MPVDDQKVFHEDDDETGYKSAFRKLKISDPAAYEKAVADAERLVEGYNRLARMLGLDVQGPGKKEKPVVPVPAGSIDREFYRLPESSLPAHYQDSRNFYDIEGQSASQQLAMGTAAQNLPFGGLRMPGRPRSRKGRKPLRFSSILGLETSETGEKSYSSQGNEKRYPCGGMGRGHSYRASHPAPTFYRKAA